MDPGEVPLDGAVSLAETHRGPGDPFRLVGAVLEKRFRVARVVAEGGYGVVYEARHLALDVPVALKVLKVPADLGDTARTSFLERFALEARTIARLRHPAIVQVLDHGTSHMPSGHEAPWIALEWLDGQPLDQVLPRLTRDERSPRAVLALLRPVFEALARAHEEGVAHRDVKPGNVMVTRSRGGRTTRLMDFGIAKVMLPDEAPAGTGATRTRADFNTFSPAYAAPEQVSGSRTGPWTDVHALALVVTEALTGKAPFPSKDLTALYFSVLAPERPTPGRLGLDVGPWEAVLSRALALRPDERPASAQFLLDALEASVPDGVIETRARSDAPPGDPADVDALPPVAVSPLGTTTLPRVRSRRRPLLFAAAIAVGALVGVGLFHRSATRRAARPAAPSVMTSAPLAAIARATPPPAAPTAPLAAPSTPPSAQASAATPEPVAPVVTVAPALRPSPGGRPIAAGPRARLPRGRVEPRALPGGDVPVE